MCRFNVCECVCGACVCVSVCSFSGNKVLLGISYIGLETVDTRSNSVVTPRKKKTEINFMVLKAQTVSLLVPTESRGQRSK